ncbi:ATP F0F1 synthase synthase [Sutterella wadsworthensis]|uniref:ATP F0F1 synthase synthase n=1 Tax=Sutterella wadsworthensis TaxID=40545 RepID=UPI0013F65104|nr:ATP F0F1 synthase synthase [Sutterella wadsworthensis]
MFVLGDRFIFFQNIPKSQLVTKKGIFRFGDNFTYRTDCEEIVIKNLPDAIYDKTTDNLYFRRLESITSIFKGIDMLYREATQEETDAFLANSFITLKGDYSSSKVKMANRKRIALAIKTLSELNESERDNIFEYIRDYCPDLKMSGKSFEIGSENELKLLIYGIEQRFYTTIVGGERRLANSIIPLNKG